MELKKLQEIIEKIGAGLQPTHDWMPALIVENKDDAAVYGFVGDSMSSYGAKDVVAEEMTKLIAKFKPDCACFVTTAWSVNFEKENLSDFEVELFKSGASRPSDHPNRVEIVNAYVYGTNVEALMIGYIQRHPDKGPTIREWEIIQEGASAEGRFPDAVKRGFQLAGLTEGG